MPSAPFRRPAALDQVDAEAVEAPGDIPVDSEVAHATARLLIGVPEDPALARLLDLVRRRGVDDICQLWSTSPATTLPGVCWRLYMISLWAERDREQVVRRFTEGCSAGRQAGIDQCDDVDLDVILRMIDDFFTGEFRSVRAPELWQLLVGVATMLRILAAGVTYGDTWITDERDDLAVDVTVRAQALSRTSRELAEAALLARVGRLD